MAETLTPDICVIGAGSGGLSVAAAAAAFGVSCVLIERHKMGGDCLNTGCVPSKALLAAAKRAALARNAAAFGIKATAEVDFAKVHDHVQRVIAAIAPTDSAERFAGLGVQVIKGHAQFKDRRTVVVGDQYAIRARRFVIATGSTPAIPPIPGLDGGAVPDQRDHLRSHGAAAPSRHHRRRSDRHGNGASLPPPRQRSDRAGSGERRCPMTIPNAPTLVVTQLEREGVVIRAGVQVDARGLRQRQRDGDARRARRAKRRSKAAICWSPPGARPAVDGLDLAAAARALRPHRRVRRTASSRPATGRIYAIGDAVAGQPKFTHAANYHAGLVIRNALFRLRVNVKKGVIPWVTFTEPELAQAGLTEAQARARRYKKLRVLRWPYHDNDRAQTERETHGHIKVVTDPQGRHPRRDRSSARRPAN